MGKKTMGKQDGKRNSLLVKGGKSFIYIYNVKNKVNLKYHT